MTGAEDTLGESGVAEPSPAAAAPVDRDAVAMLDRLGSTIVEALGFGVAVINIARPDGSLQVVSVAGDEGARRVLLGAVNSAETWDTMLAVSEPWGLLRFADHASEASTVEMIFWIPDGPAAEGEGLWHPEDALFAPLMGSDGTRIGILSVDLPPEGRRPGPTICKALEAFAVATGLAIENATLRVRAEASEQRYREMATRDGLTGVGNRSVLLDRLEHALRARHHEQTTMALVFIDLDGFKAVNDAWSHAAGDRLLSVLAARISETVRPHDTVVRWGGDEFLVLLERLTDDDTVAIVAQRIRAAISTPVDYEGHEMLVTASVGIALRTPDDRFDADELIRRADAAMYQTKRRGLLPPAAR